MDSRFHRDQLSDLPNNEQKRQLIRPHQMFLRHSRTNPQQRPHPFLQDIVRFQQYLQLGHRLGRCLQHRNSRLPLSDVRHQHLSQSLCKMRLHHLAERSLQIFPTIDQLQLHYFLRVGHLTGRLHRYFLDPQNPAKRRQRVQHQP